MLTNIFYLQNCKMLDVYFFALYLFVLICFFWFFNEIICFNSDKKSIRIIRTFASFF